MRRPAIPKAIFAGTKPPPVTSPHQRPPCRRHHRPRQRLQRGCGEAGDLPVEGDLGVVGGGEVHQAAGGEVGAGEGFGVQRPAHAGEAGLDEGLRRGQPVGGQVEGVAGHALGPGVLQAVLLVEGEGGGGGEGLGRDALGEVAGGKLGAGGDAVGEAAERAQGAAGHGLGEAGDGGQHTALAQPVGGVILVIDREGQEVPGFAREGGERGDEPGAQAVGIGGDGDGDALAGVGGLGEMAEELGFQHADMVHVAAEPGAGLGCRAGRAAGDEHEAEAVFQRLDALRDGGGRDMQRRGGAVEAAGADDSGDGEGGGIVEHG